MKSGPTLAYIPNQIKPPDVNALFRFGLLLLLLLFTAVAGGGGGGQWPGPSPSHM